MIKKVLPKNKSEVILAILLCLFLIGLFARVSYLFDLTNHFRGYFLVVFLCTVIYKSFKKYERTIWIYIALALLFNLNTTPDFPRLASHHTSNSQIKIMHFNLLISNDDYHKTINLIRANQPNVISFQEATFPWVQALTEELNEYRFICKAINSPFGICVALDIPVLQESIFYLQDPDIPGIYVKSKVNNNNVSFVFVHPKPPFNQSFFEQRNSYFIKLINKIKDYENLILVGDLNITQWSPIYHDLEKKLELRNTLSGFDNTWPTFLPFKIFQLDHIMLSKNLKLTNSKVLENIGSDHYPIISEIKINN